MPVATLVLGGAVINDLGLGRVGRSGGDSSSASADPVLLGGLLKGDASVEISDLYPELRIGGLDSDDALAGCEEGFSGRLGGGIGTGFVSRRISPDRLGGGGEGG